MSFQVFHCLVQSEVKQIILVKSSLSEVRFKLHEVALREVMSQCNYSPLNYRPQRSCGKVVFLHLSVILFTGSCLADAPKQTPPLGRHPAWADNSPRQTLPRQTPPQADTPSQRQPLQRKVRILLECVHVFPISLLTGCSSLWHTDL